VGTLFGVYEFLERQLRVRWLWPGKLGEAFPGKRALGWARGTGCGSRHCFILDSSTTSGEMTWAGPPTRRRKRTCMTNPCGFAGNVSQEGSVSSWTIRTKVRRFGATGKGSTANTRSISICYPVANVRLTCFTKRVTLTTLA
jgi:hypothetical protein